MDVDFFGTLYANHHLRMLRFARKIVRDPSRAADLVQTVFVRLFGREELLKSLTDALADAYPGAGQDH